MLSGCCNTRQVGQVTALQVLSCGYKESNTGTLKAMFFSCWAKGKPDVQKAAALTLKISQCLSI